LDACVLYPAPLRDLLMWSASTGLFAVRWSADILNEWTENLLRNRPDLKRARLERTCDEMNRAVPDAMVTDFESLVPMLTLPDADDRHVLAAAIACNAEVILTLNRKRPVRGQWGGSAAVFLVLVSGAVATLALMSDVTRLIDAAATGDVIAAADLLPLVYDELRKLATARLAAEKPGQTLQATALVHDAYLRLVGESGGPEWNGRRHFFAAAAEAMRRVLVEAARRKARHKHGGDRRRVDLEALTVAAQPPDDDVVAVSEALDALAREDPAKAELVKLRYFAGLTLEEAAACQRVSLATAKRRWVLARAWLFDAISTIP